MAIHDMTYTAQSMSYTCTYHLPASENLTRFLQAHPATPGWTCSRGWRAWRGLAGGAAHGRPGHSLAPVLLGRGLAGGAAPADLDWRPQCSWGVGWRARRPTAALDITRLRV